MTYIINISKIAPCVTVYHSYGIGNRVSSNTNGVETRHTFNARNQLIQTLEGDNITDYLYDKRGNLTQQMQNGQLQSSYTFDATNMMVAATTQGKGTAEYTYNGFRNRVAKLESYTAAQSTPGVPGIPIPADPTKELRYVLDMTRPYDNLLMTQGTQEQSFIWGNDLLSATGSNNADSFHYLQDHLGSPIRLLGNNDHDTTIAYDEFGVPEVTAGITQPFGFTGYQTDDITGLYYAQARYYAPQVGFTAEDPVKNHLNFLSVANPNNVVRMQAGNAYSYCVNNPLNYVDPSGLFCMCGVENCGGRCMVPATAPQQSTTSGNQPWHQQHSSLNSPAPQQSATSGNQPWHQQHSSHNSPAPQLNTAQQDDECGLGTLHVFAPPPAGSDISDIFADYFTGGNRWGHIVGGAHVFDTILERLIFDPNDPRYWRRNAAVRNHAFRARLIPGIAGAGAVGLDVWDGVQENRAQGEPIENIMSDAMADVVVSGTGVAIATLAAAWAGGKAGATVGSVIPVKGTLLGAAGGFVGGGLAYLALDVFSPGGYTVREHARAAAREGSYYECLCGSGLHYARCCGIGVRR